MGDNSLIQKYISHFRRIANYNLRIFF